MRGALRSCIEGAAVTLSATVMSCYLACVVEKTANRALFRLRPQLYEGVSYAYGLDLSRHRRQQQQPNQNEGSGGATFAYSERRDSGHREKIFVDNM
mmetsp:Transcript_4828/g.7019  ORF Transcript_4828/g.7019 Transcript_4828/m.7019 type:complete len:97 (-) Transcript_4828:464-754(-)|eukprot:CAMPEP_0116027356 /NCGR_PEP_ID=MMETSP0321-20121206/14581_1 /TAXON_ID=163516 /ORGANISM="Leptocylindrus danicus var. danicus, Strain B650" /LENGTH=96 /DNA_ID=CAMNT_0003500697 /DNA_START=87 /DNA_END=377 /DNA_ORIENTATION=+